MRMLGEWVGGLNRSQLEEHGFNEGVGLLSPIEQFDQLESKFERSSGAAASHHFV